MTDKHLKILILGPSNSYKTTIAKWLQSGLAMLNIRAKITDFEDDIPSFDESQSEREKSIRTYQDGFPTEIIVGTTSPKGRTVFPEGTSAPSVGIYHYSVVEKARALARLKQSFPESELTEGIDQLLTSMGIPIL